MPLRVYNNMAAGLAISGLVGYLAVAVQFGIPMPIS